MSHARIAAPIGGLTVGRQRPIGQVKQVVWHWPAAPKWEAPHMVEYMQRPSTEVSVHWVVDSRQAIECVPPTWVAYHAKGHNPHTIGIEICGDHTQDLDPHTAMWAVWVARLALRDANLPLPAKLTWTPDSVLVDHATIDPGRKIDVGRWRPQLEAAWGLLDSVL